MSQFTRKFGGSPAFSVKLAAITNGLSTVVDFESDTFNGRAGSANKYVPLNFIRVLNRSAQPLDIYLNQDAGNIVTVDAGQDMVLTDIPIKSLTVANIGTAATNDNEVIVTGRFEKFGTQDVVDVAVKKGFFGGV